MWVVTNNFYFQEDMAMDDLSLQLVFDYSLFYSFKSNSICLVGRPGRA